MRELILTADEPTAIDRRTLLTRAGVGGAGLLMGGFLAGCGGNDNHHSSKNNGSSFNEIDVLNFALNLEYLESAYYTIGAGNAYGLSDTDFRGTANTSAGNVATGGTVVGGHAVTFGSLGPYFQEIAYDEAHHVQAVRTVISNLGGTPVARPNINFTDAFAAAGAAAGNPGFDPFASEANFLLGAFLLSDVGATAYVGGNEFLTSTLAKRATAQVLAVEGYHVGSIRTLIANAGGTAVTQSQGIAAARRTLNLGMAPTIDDRGVDEDPEAAAVANSHNIAPTDANALAFARSFSEVLAVAYLNNTTNTASGGFFPNGTNGTIHTI